MLTTISKANIKVKMAQSVGYFSNSKFSNVEFLLNSIIDLEINEHNTKIEILLILYSPYHKKKHLPIHIFLITCTSF